MASIREHHHRALAGLLPSLDGVQIDEVDLATLNGHAVQSNPSASVTANSASICCNSC
jgi:hypothetical protein